MENESLSLYDNRLQNKEINILKTILPYLGSLQTLQFQALSYIIKLDFYGMRRRSFYGR